MQFLIQLAILVITSAIAYALAPKPPKQKAPTLEDFDLPTAEEGRSIPWIFGTYKITDPNFIWYGDLEVRTKTKDKVKTRLYRMGTQQEFCISPVDALVALEYGGKDCGITEVTSSQQISINLPNLFGGRDKEGGIDGDFDVCFGEPTQGVNDYLLAQIGAPLSAFRDSLTLVGRKPSWVANSTYIKPLLPTVRCITEGWEDGACWYPERAAIPDREASTGELVQNEWVAVRIVKDGLSLYLFVGGVLNDSVTLDEEILGGQYGAPGPYYSAFVIGRYHTVDPQYSYTGYIDEFLFFRDVALSTSNYTPSATQIDGTHPNWADLEICLLMNDSDGATTFTDSTGRAWTRIAGAEIDTDQSVFGGSSGHFHTNGAIHTPFDSSISFAGTWTIDLRMRPQVLHTYEAIFSAYQINGTFPGYILMNRGDGRLEFYVGNHNYPSGDVYPLARLYQSATEAAVWDMNPAHVIYKALTSTDQGAAEPSATIDDASFTAAADTFYGEGLGVSIQWRNEGSIREFLGEICRHAGAMLSLDPQTALTQLIPLRDDYDSESLDLITEDDVIEVIDWQDAADGEVVNEVTVEFRRRDSKKGSVTWVNRASVQQQGVSHETMQFPGISRESLALRIAKRECMQRSSNLSKGKIKFNRVGWDKLPGAVFRFSHGPENIEELVLRVIDIDTGTLTDGAITISVVQDIFSLGDALEIGEQESEWVAPDTDPAPATAQALMESPYWQLLGEMGAAEASALDVGAGYVVPLVGKPTGLCTGFNTWLRISPADYAETSSDQAFSPAATLAAALDRSTSASLSLSDGIDLDLVEVGWLAVIGTGATAEICYVNAIDADAGTGTFSRGRFDTTPGEHPAGTRVWFVAGAAVDWQRDATPYVDLAAVDMKVQTVTGVGVLDLASATATSCTLASRQIRPYPPGNVEINGEAYPTLLDGALTVTWAHRDRVAQGLSHIAQSDATDYGPEAGTTYNAYAYSDDTDALLDSDTGISGASWSPSVPAGAYTLRIEIEAERDGYVSWQRQIRIFDYLDSPGILDADGEAVLDADGEYIQEA